MKLETSVSLLEAACPLKDSLKFFILHFKYLVFLTDPPLSCFCVWFDGHSQVTHIRFSIAEMLFQELVSNLLKFCAAKSIHNNAF